MTTVTALFLFYTSYPFPHSNRRTQFLKTWNGSKYDNYAGLLTSPVIYMTTGFQFFVISSLLDDENKGLHNR